MPTMKASFLLILRRARDVMVSPIRANHNIIQIL